MAKTLRRFQLWSKPKASVRQIISHQAGAWLSLRGHLDNLSDNMLLGAVNAYNDEVGKGKNVLNGELESFSQIARQYKRKTDALGNYWR